LKVEGVTQRVDVGGGVLLWRRCRGTARLGDRAVCR